MAITILMRVIILIIIANTLEAICAWPSSKCFLCTEVCIILTITLSATLPLPHKSHTCVLQGELSLKIRIPTEHSVEPT